MDGSTLKDSICYRHYKVAGKYDSTISVHKNVAVGESLTCYIPNLILPP